ncbi:MFS transporter [Candidatus Roizmanbacteria bacterium]|nr:MFS transporter [Candidatus Roizmanbacteria bacterium]
MSFGIGLGLAPLTNSATSTVPVHEVGIASSLLALVRNIAGAFGTAIFATILSNSITSSLLSVQKYSVVNTTDPGIITQYMSLMAAKANISAYVTVFNVAMVIMILGAFSAIFVKHNPSVHEKGEKQLIDVESI